MPISGFSSISIPGTLTPSILWGILAVVLVLFVIATAVLLFHWRTYGKNNSVIFITELIYWAGAIVLFMSMVATITLY